MPHTAITQEDPSAVEKQLVNQREIDAGDRVITVADEITVIALAEDREVWDRQPAETSRQYEGFQLWLSLPSHQRSYIGVQRRLRENGETHTSAGAISEWCQRNRWMERTAAWDSYTQKRFADELLEERLRARREASELGRSMRLKALEALQVLNATIYQKVRDPETGEVKMELRSSLSPNEIARLAEVGTRLERDALDLDDTHPDGSPKEPDGVAGVNINIFQGAATEQQILGDAEAILEARRAQQRTIEGIARAVDEG